MPKPVFFFLVYVTLGHIESTIGYSNEPQSQAFTDDQMVCGPRCVHFVLRWYDSCDVELIDLIREMQWPDLLNGITYKHMHEALAKRGIHSRLVTVDADQFTPRYPSIVYFMAEEAGSNEMGHFAVWLPNSGSTTLRIWDGQNGVKEMSRSDFRKRFSGYALVPTKEANPGALCMRRFEQTRLWILFLVVVGILGTFFCSRKEKLRCFAFRFSL